MATSARVTFLNKSNCELAFAQRHAEKQKENAFLLCYFSLYKKTKYALLLMAFEPKASCSSENGSLELLSFLNFRHGKFTIYTTLVL